MSHLVTVLGAGKFFGQSGIEDDFTDRLHYIFTSGILVMFSVGVSWKQFGGKPLECSVPEQVPGIGSEEFVESYCFTQDTYFVREDSSIPLSNADRSDSKIKYYQWVPFVLLAQALVFRIPCMFWKMVASQSGIKVHHLVAQASDERNIDLITRQATIEMLAIHMENALRYHRRVGKRGITPHVVFRWMNLPYSSAYVGLMYICTKLMYLLTVTISFVWLNRFMLKTDQYEYYGFGALYDLMNGSHWAHSGLFPRITICDFPVRTLGQVQHFSIQCAVMINMLNEKIFIFLWLWYVVLMGLSILSTSYWVLVILTPWFRRWFIVRHLELADMPFDSKESAAEIERFVFNFLYIDGVFILRMVTGHAGVVMGTDLTVKLWKRFYGIKDKVRRSPSLNRKVSKQWTKSKLKQHLMNLSVPQTANFNYKTEDAADDKREGSAGGSENALTLPTISVEHPEQKEKVENEKKQQKEHVGFVDNQAAYEDENDSESSENSEYVADFTRSPVYQEEKAYDEAMRKIRSRCRSLDRIDYDRAPLTSLLMETGRFLPHTIRKDLGEKPQHDCFNNRMTRLGNRHANAGTTNAHHSVDAMKHAFRRK